jgi:hypothetical protein
MNRDILQIGSTTTAEEYAMFSKFQAVRNASRDLTSYTDTTAKEHGIEVGDPIDQVFLAKLKVLADAIGVLSDNDLRDLTGACLFGRDCVVPRGTNPHTLLATWTLDHADLVPHNNEMLKKNHVGYMASKPIDRYLSQAEKKLSLS